MPAIDPFSAKNRELSEDEIDERLAHYDIPTDLPTFVQVSRFEPWKDPQGVIAAFREARKEVEATLVLLGNDATDDEDRNRQGHGNRLADRTEHPPPQLRLQLYAKHVFATVSAIRTNPATDTQKVESTSILPELQ